MASSTFFKLATGLTFTLPGYPAKEDGTSVVYTKLDAVRAKDEFGRIWSFSPSLAIGAQGTEGQSPAVPSTGTGTGTGGTGAKGAKGDKGDKGDKGATGPAGPGVAIGGTAGQQLEKVDGTDFNTQWETRGHVPVAGAAGQVLSKIDGTDFNTQWIDALPFVQLQRNIPMVAGNYIEIGHLFRPNGAHTFRLSISASDVGYSISKEYLVVANYSATAGVWLTLQPISNTGPWSGADFAVDVFSADENFYMRLRAASVNAFSGVANIIFEDLGYHASGVADVFTQTSATGTQVPIPTTPYNPGNMFAGFIVSTVNRNLPTVINDYVEIGNLARVSGSHVFRLSACASFNVSLAKHYIVNVEYNQTAGAWQVLQPLTDGGPYSGNDFAIDINVNAATVFLRIRRTAGATADSVAIVIEDVSGNPGSGNEVFSSTSATGSTSAPAVTLRTPVVPPGGSTNQVLAKVDGTDFNSQWVTPAPSTDVLQVQIFS